MSTQIQGALRHVWVVDEKGGQRCSRCLQPNDPRVAGCFCDPVSLVAHESHDMVENRITGQLDGWKGCSLCHVHECAVEVMLPCTATAEQMTEDTLALMKSIEANTPRAPHPITGHPPAFGNAAHKPVVPQTYKAKRGKFWSNCGCCKKALPAKELELSEVCVACTAKLLKNARLERNPPDVDDVIDAAEKEIPFP